MGNLAPFWTKRKMKWRSRCVWMKNRTFLAVSEATKGNLLPCHWLGCPGCPLSQKEIWHSLWRAEIQHWCLCLWRYMIYCCLLHCLCRLNFPKLERKCEKSVIPDYLQFHKSLEHVGVLTGTRIKYLACRAGFCNSNVCFEMLPVKWICDNLPVNSVVMKKQKSVYTTCIRRVMSGIGVKRGERVHWFYHIF